MNIFRREVLISRIPKKIFDLSYIFFNIFLKFKNPLEIFLSYINMSPPRGNFVEFKNGIKIFLSPNPHDILTVVVIFARKEYGPIKPQASVVDIGANIGVFSIYAILNGASKVFAFEPNMEAYQMLCKNIEENNLPDVIIPYNLAVGGESGKKVLIPKLSSPYNRIFEGSPNSVVKNATQEFNEVFTISLESILQKHFISRLQLCKMDCEGAEYDILYNTNPQTLGLVDEIRMEYHESIQAKNSLVAFLNEFGFSEYHEKYCVVWLRKPYLN
ncbi:FkbM family methyltransferase [Flavilitoribacter nigricans]|uniref:Methyltransferase FkbM domain-containing protein n=1 Tax=Flavilitoribacter nigricans (strain ATCC 23147 / DSM 23189 / NBRC 102662 / NCIMB 1420 / SS-2) TaxID=1122177 RepID=A0A2D0MZE2_FLAN2|nr:FkbM family methyltransferase [Flavilitoribacter nigricans]PHN01486.1 hypothetical protein CRP01_36915 [Flavilitoribacter nigricans DSM 23189 = NBRC 102662]